MNRNSFFFRSASVLCGLLLIAIVTLPSEADAQWVVHDPFNQIVNTISSIATAATQVKGYTLDPLAWALAKSVLQSIVKSTVNSVNKGPNGQPAFSTNITTNLKTAGDTAANSFISQLNTNGSIKSPYQTTVASVVGNQYLQSTGSNGFFTQNAYTLNKVSPNPTAFYNGDLANGGGMPALMSAWINPANNPLGAANQATQGLNASVGSAQYVAEKELSYGSGFASSRGTCNTTTTGGSTKTSSSANSLGGLLTSLSANSGCQSSPIQTPGSVIKTSLEKSLGSGIDTLVNTHTFEEIITSVLSQLVTQVLGPGGLSGTSQPSTSATTASGTAAPATSYFNQTDPTQAVINTQLSTQFESTVSNQITQLQQFQTNWNTINNAALAANAALSNSSCTTNAQYLITTTVQPVLQQASTEISLAHSGVTSLQSMQVQLQSIASSTSDQTATLSGISSSYTQLLSKLPSAADVAYAANQSQDNSIATTSPPTLYTQMNQIAAQANACRTNI